MVSVILIVELACRPTFFLWTSLSSSVSAATCVAFPAASMSRVCVSELCTSQDKCWRARRVGVAVGPRDRLLLISLCTGDGNLVVESGSFDGTSNAALHLAVVSCPSGCCDCLTAEVGVHLLDGAEGSHLAASFGVRGSAAGVVADVSAAAAG